MYCLHAVFGVKVDILCVFLSHRDKSKMLAENLFIPFSVFSTVVSDLHKSVVIREDFMSSNSLF